MSSARDSGHGEISQRRPRDAWPGAAPPANDALAAVLVVTVTLVPSRWQMGRMRSHSPRAFSRLERDAALPVCGLLWNKTAK